MVLTLRDLFQVVYENKKKEMEAAKKQQTEPTDAATKEETPQTGKMPHTFCQLVQLWIDENEEALCDIYFSNK